MKLFAALLCLATQSSAVALPNLHLDFIGGGLAQINPPTEYLEPVISGFPPSLVILRRPFYQAVNRQVGSQRDAALTGFGSAAELRLIAAARGEAWEAGADYAARLEYFEQNRPFGFSRPPLSHRSWGPFGTDPPRPWGDEVLGTEITARFERLSLKLGPWRGLSLSAGRQPIGLATNFYFTPNDLFQPFYPADFLRLYRPGIDSARLTYDLGELSQAELIAAAGYAYDFMGGVWANERFSPEFDKRKAALLGRLHADVGKLAVGTLFGWDANRNLAGLSTEYDLGEGWMLGFEGNGSVWDDDPAKVWYDGSLGLSWQFTPAFTARTEFASSPSFPVCPFCASLEREQRSLHALGMNWDSQGLWKLGMVNLSDLDRWEGLLSLNAQYSLASESDLIFGAQFPWRFPKERPFTATAFELAPLSGSVQLRWYL